MSNSTNGDLETPQIILAQASGLVVRHLDASSTQVSDKYQFQGFSVVTPTATVSFQPLPGASAKGGTNLPATVLNYGHYPWSGQEMVVAVGGGVVLSIRGDIQP